MNASEAYIGLAYSLDGLAKQWRARARRNERAADQMLNRGEAAWTDCQASAQRFNECAGQVERRLEKYTPHQRAKR